MYKESVSANFIKRSYAKAKEDEDISVEFEKKSIDKLSIEDKLTSQKNQEFIQEPITIEKEAKIKQIKTDKVDKIQTPRIKIIDDKNQDIGDTETKTLHPIEVKRRKIFVFLTLVFFAGMIYGSLVLSVNQSDLIEILSNINKEQLTSKANGTFLDIFLNNFLVGFLFISLSYICGFSAISHVIPVSMVFVKGLGYGSYMGYMYITYGMNGFLYCVFVVLPSGILLMIAMLTSAKESIDLSNVVLQSFFQKEVTKNTQKEKNYRKISRNLLKIYTIRNIILLGLVVLSSLMDAILTKTFATVFVLN